MALAVIMIIAFITLQPVLDFSFTNWDDQFYVWQNDDIKDISIEGIRNIFKSNVLGHYHPVTIFSFALEYHFFQLDPYYYHLDNLLIHLLNTALVFWLIILLTKRVWAAIIVALLFSVHPMHVESVAWISERKGLLCGLFFLSSLITYIHYLKKSKFKNNYLLLTFFFFIVASLSKAVAVTLPVVLLIIDHYYKRKEIRKLLQEKIVFFLLAIGFGLYAIQSQHAEGAVHMLETPNINIFDRLIIGINNLGIYIAKAVVPYQVSCLYPYPKKVAGTLPLLYYITPFLMIIVGLISYKSVKHSKIILLGTLFFLATILLFLQFIPIGDVIMADRYTYLPYIGLFLLLGVGWDHLFLHKKNATVALFVLLIGYTFSLSYQSYQRIGVWKNSGTLWTDVISNFPKVSLAYNNRSKIYIEQEKFELAIADYNMALKLNPSSFDAYNNRGNAYRKLGKMELAIQDYNAAIKLNRSFAMAYSNRSQSYYFLKDYEQALNDGLKAESLGFRMQKEYMDWLKKAVGTN